MAYNGSMSLTERQRRSPHAPVRDKRGNLSVLERSFAGKNLDEIEFWEQQGVVDAAMSGQARSRREYSMTLMDHVLEGASVLYHDPDRARRFQAVLAGLWERGASDHGHRYSQWLVGAIGYGLGHTLLDAGANPHIVDANKKNPVTELWRHLASAQHQAHDDGLKMLGHTPDEREKLAKMVDRCLSVPGAPQEMLDSYLAQVVFCGLRARAEDQAQWRAWRDRLLGLGARPTLGYDGPLALFAQAGPGDGAMGDYEILRALRPGQWGSLKDRPLSQEEQVQALLLRQARDAHWITVSEEWMEALAPHLPAARAAAPHRSLSYVDWMRLLVQPNGIALAARWRDCGVPAPWQNGDDTSQAYHLLASGSSRVPGLLSRLRTLLKLCSDQVDLKWADACLKEYLNAPFAWRPSPEEHKSMLWARIDRNRQRDPMSVAEWSDWLAVLDHRPGAALPPTVWHWWGVGPEAWSKDHDHAIAVFDFLVERGVPDSLFAPEPGDEQWSPGDVSRFSRYEWQKSWLHHDDNRNRLLARAPHLAPRVHGLAALLTDDRAARHQHLLALRAAAPDACTQQCSAMATGILQGMDGWFGNARYLQEKLERCADLARFGARMEQPLLTAALDKLLEKVGGNPRFAPASQVACIEHLAQAGYNFMAHGHQALAVLLQRERALPASNPAALACLEPLVSALFAVGTNVLELPDARPDRPLGNLVAIEQDRHRMEATTAVAHAPARSRRL